MGVVGFDFSNEVVKFNVFFITYLFFNFFLIKFLLEKKVYMYISYKIIIMEKWRSIVMEGWV